MVSPLGTAFEGEIESVRIDTRSGQLTIMPQHADFLAFFDVTEVRIAPLAGGPDAPEAVWACAGHVHVKGDDVFVIAQFTDPEERTVRAVNGRLVSARRPV